MARPASQFAGPGEDTIEIAGRLESVETTMGATGLRQKVTLEAL